MSFTKSTRKALATKTAAAQKVLATALLLTAVSLSAAAQGLRTDGATYDLGQIGFGQAAVARFTVENTGGATRIAEVRTDCGCTTVSYPQRTIAGGERFTVDVAYDASLMGHFNKAVALYPEGGDPLWLRVKGIVTDEATTCTLGALCPLLAAEAGGSYGCLRSDLSEVEFDEVRDGERYVRRLHFVNSSSATVSPQVMHLPSWLTAEVEPREVTAGGHGTVTLTLDAANINDFGLCTTSLYLGMYAGDKVSADKELPVSAIKMGEQTATEGFAPTLKLSADIVDIASGSSSASVVIENVGKGVLEISHLQMYTAGIKVRLNKSHLAPGERTTLKISAVRRLLQGVRSKPRVLMLTNDPNCPKAVININVR